ncbi:unnamed protein product [Vitrella brassicaformis CCMP3155]|uniref:EF-hand domain-containing protein n=1 Tax=Vitrella brassicaformis (strain CCMP3155) TaxID=1169540 RepID=A0A0G4GNQ1_VITBC|nr:unnamed protein product [Vitrella brassicaformis CCMP3155]|eukprot:CEM31912.1 unnamed protein product [Vitrella brassicaformis CCMP3155]
MAYYRAFQDNVAQQFASSAPGGYAHGMTCNPKGAAYPSMAAAGNPSVRVKHGAVAPGSYNIISNMPVHSSTLRTAGNTMAGSGSPYNRAYGPIVQPPLQPQPRPKDHFAHRGMLQPSVQGESTKISAEAIELILDGFRMRLKKFGANGIKGLGRKFRIMDDNGNKRLNMYEFKKAMREMDVVKTDAEAEVLFKVIDRNDDGNIDYEEFLRKARGSMNERRRGFVKMAFKLMDKTGNGVIDAEDVKDTYDVSKHPDVICGWKTKEQVLEEFLETFDLKDSKKGSQQGPVTITWEEWLDYYDGVSVSIDDDDYFELMMRNAWHLSGGEGWCENTSNIRCLVTHTDGRQTVEEIKDDLGVRRSDLAEIKRRLQLQGINPVKVELYG